MRQRLVDGRRQGVVIQILVISSRSRRGIGCRQVILGRDAVAVAVHHVTEHEGMARFHRIDAGLAPLRPHRVDCRQQPLPRQGTLHGGPRHARDDRHQGKRQQHFDQRVRERRAADLLIAHGQQQAANRRRGCAKVITILQSLPRCTFRKGTVPFSWNENWDSPQPISRPVHSDQLFARRENKSRRMDFSPSWTRSNSARRRAEAHPTLRKFHAGVIQVRISDSRMRPLTAWLSRRSNSRGSGSRA